MSRWPELKAAIDQLKTQYPEAWTAELESYLQTQDQLMGEESERLLQELKEKVQGGTN